MKLGDIAYARSGDKGGHVNIGLIAQDPKDYPFLCAFLEEKRVQTYFGKWKPVSVKRFALPKIHALNFMLYEVLDGGASLNLRADAQGKAFGQALLQMNISDAYTSYHS